MTSTPVTIGMPGTGTDRTVRPALPSDAPDIARIQREAMATLLSAASAGEASVEEHLPPQELLNEQWAATLSAPAPAGCGTFVAIHGQAVGAFALALPAEPVDEIPDKRPAIPAGTEIAALEVDANFQRSGHASRLLNAIKDSIGGANLRMWVSDVDEARQQLVQSSGFAPAGVRRRFEVGGQVITEHLWWAEIHPS